MISYNNSLPEPNLEDLQNLEFLLNGSNPVELSLFKFEEETVQLQLDDFPDIHTVNTYNFPDATKLYQKALLKCSNQLVGTLSMPDRRKKIQKYLEKKKKRTWIKKIHYDCRKKVADQRVRVKGRFVSKVQAVAFSEDKEINYKSNL